MFNEAFIEGLLCMFFFMLATVMSWELFDMFLRARKATKLEKLNARNKEIRKIADDAVDYFKRYDLPSFKDGVHKRITEHNQVGADTYNKFQKEITKGINDIAMMSETVSQEARKLRSEMMANQNLSQTINNRVDWIMAHAMLRKPKTNLKRRRK